MESNLVLQRPYDLNTKGPTFSVLFALEKRWTQVLSVTREQHNCRQGLRDEAISRTKNYTRLDQQLRRNVA